MKDMINEQDVKRSHNDA